MPARFKTLPPHREKVEKNVAQRVAAGFVTDVIVIFRSVYRKPEQQVLLASEPEARAAKIQIIESAVMKSLDVVAGALLKRNARMSIPSLPVSVESSGAAAHPDPHSGSGVLVSSWLTNSVSFLASPDWIKKLASNKNVARIITSPASLRTRPSACPSPFA